MCCGKREHVCSTCQTKWIAAALQQGLPKRALSAAAGPYDFHAGSNGPGGYHGARRSLTNLSELGAEKSPESANRFRAPPESLEAQLSHKLQASCTPYLTVLFFHYAVSVLSS